METDEYDSFAEYSNRLWEAYFMCDNKLFLIVDASLSQCHVLDLVTKQWQQIPIESAADEYKSISNSDAFVARHDNGYIDRYQWDAKQQRVNQWTSIVKNCGRGLIWVEKLNVLINGNLDSKSKRISYRSCSMKPKEKVEKPNSSISAKYRWTADLPKLHISLAACHAEHCLVLETVVVLSFWNQQESNSGIWCLDLISKKWYKSSYNPPEKVPMQMISTKNELMATEDELHFIRVDSPTAHYKAKVIDIVPKELQEMCHPLLNLQVVGYCRWNIKKKSPLMVPQDILEIIANFCREEKEPCQGADTLLPKKCKWNYNYNPDREIYSIDDCYW